jgi:hypothetical protein
MFRNALEGALLNESTAQLQLPNRAKIEHFLSGDRAIPFEMRLMQG